MMHWLDFLFPPRVDEIALRDISNDDFLALVVPQLVSETRPDTVMLLPFSDTRVRTVIHEAKYHGSERAFSLLALALSEYLRDADDVGHPMSHIVPIPLGAVRRKERGFNQVHEVIRRALQELSTGSEKGEVVHSYMLEPDLLVRTRETESQVSLLRHKREENMRGAFRVVQDVGHSVNPAYTYIVVDDVLTTGATLQAAIDALKGAGAEHIIPLALAH